MGYRFTINGSYNADPTVYKVIFGTKFYIWKGKNLRQSVEIMSEDIDRFLRKGIDQKHLLAKVINHITRSRVISCRVEPMLQTDNLAELIEYERTELINSKENPDCLNQVFEPHIPKWIGEVLSTVKETDQEAVKIVQIENKPLRATITKPVVSMPEKQLDSSTQPKETLSEKARRIAETMEKIRNSKSE